MHWKRTFYNHTEFRSQLEAKWALVFDLLGVYWEYEPEQINLRNGWMYTPDFFVYNFDGYTGWIEIKPHGVVKDEAYEKVKLLSIVTQQPAMLISNIAVLYPMPRWDNGIKTQMRIYQKPDNVTYTLFGKREIFRNAFNEMNKYRFKYDDI